MGSNPEVIYTRVGSLICLPISLIGLVYFSLILSHNVNEMKLLSFTMGNVTHIDIKPHGRSHSSIVIKYLFQLDEKVYVGNISDIDASLKRKEELLDTYRIGAIIKIYYKADNPNNNYPEKSGVVDLFFPIFGLVVSIGLLLFLIFLVLIIPDVLLIDYTSMCCHRDNRYKYSYTQVYQQT